MKAEDRAEQLFRDGFTCSQAVFAACSPGLDQEAALGIAACFGGGIGRSGKICGACTGGLMALGFAFGNRQKGNQEAKAKNHAMARSLMGQFATRHGSTECNALLGGDISTEEGHKALRELGVFSTLCPQLVRSSAELVSNILASTGA